MEQRKRHRKKMVAPIVITVLVVLYYIGVAVLFSTTITELPRIAVILLLVVPLAVAAAMIWVLVERIKEIRSGEEDDLSQY